MNERIRRLAENAGYEPDVCGIHLDPRIEWFAKYIVEECADLCLKYAEFEGPFGDMEMRTGQHFYTIIKNHFGIEE